jgi:hypothetical protein
MTARRLRLTIVASLCALAGAVLFASAPALAKNSYVFSSSFGSVGSGAGQLSSPGGVAVNSATHDVYVADPGNVRVDEFDSSGSFIRAWGWGVADGLPGFETCTLSCLPGIPGSEPGGQLLLPSFIAVDNSPGGPSSGDVYVVDSGGNNLIDKFSASGEYISTITGPFGAVAVDAAGNLWAEGHARGLLALAEFDPTGGAVANWEETEYGGRNAIAVDPADNVYAALGGNGDVAKYTSAGTRLSFAPTCQECTNGLAFDPSAGVLFADQGTTVLESDPAGSPIQQFGSGSLTGGQGLAVDSVSHTLFVADLAANAISVFVRVAQPDVIVEAPSNIQHTSVTLNGTVKTHAIEATGIQFEYGTTAAYGTALAASPPTCPAASSSCPVTAELTGLEPGTTYHYRLDATNVNGTNEGPDATFTTPPAVEGVSSGAASQITPTGAVLTGALAPNGTDAHYYFQYGTSASYGSTSPAPPGTDAGSASEGVPATTTLSGLEPLRAYHFRLVATNAFGTTYGEDQTFTTTSVPLVVVESTSPANVTSTSADMRAQINPEGFDTHYRFEYISDSDFQGNGNSFAGPHPATSVPAVEADLGAQGTDQGVTVHVQGLAPATVYRYRVLATNKFGTGEGPATTFTTREASASTALPDNRAYEMVSPVDKNGGDAGFVLEEEAEGGMWNFSRGSVSGDRLIYASRSGFGGPLGMGFIEQYVATRTPDGWSSRPIDPPNEHTEGPAIPIPYLWMAFTSELTAGVLTNFDPQLTADAPAQYNDLYLSDLSNPASPSYRALNTVTPPRLSPGALTFTPAFVGASADFSHVVFEANDLLTPEAIPGVVVYAPTNIALENMYEWVNGQLHLVNISPSGAPMPGASPGPGGVSLDGQVDIKGNQAPRNGAGEVFVGQGVLVEHTVSADGSRIFFTGVEDQLYLRKNADRPQSPIGGQGECTVPTDACTVKVSASQKTNGAGPGGTDPSGPQRAHYWDASADGSVVYFSSCEQLTNDSTAVSSGGCEQSAGGRLERISGQDLYRFDVNTGHLTDLTVDSHAEDTLGADVQGVLGAGEDGSYLYFVAHGKLATGATSGQDNLYLYHEGETRYIATLRGGYSSGQPTDNRCAHFCSGDSPDWSELPKHRTVRVSPDGRHLAFDSEARLTGYDNTLNGGGNCQLKVSSENGGEASSACKEVYLYDATANRLVCASCDPTGTRPLRYSTLEPPMSPNYTPHNLSDDGSRLFFETRNALVAGDTNGRQDVYEYTHGRAYLISGGTASTSSYFLDASPSGNDVFFLTRQQLVASDRDRLFDVYDARVGGGFPRISQPECVGTGCQGVPSVPPIFSTPSSETFNGVGNFAPPVSGPAVNSKKKGCRRGFHRRHGKCVKAKHVKRAKRSGRASGRGHGQRRGK